MKTRYPLRHAIKIHILKKTANALMSMSSTVLFERLKTEKFFFFYSCQIRHLQHHLKKKKKVQVEMSLER